MRWRRLSSQEAGLAPGTKIGPRVFRKVAGQATAAGRTGGAETKGARLGNREEQTTVDLLGIVNSRRASDEGSHNGRGKLSLPRGWRQKLGSPFRRLASLDTRWWWSTAQHRRDQPTDLQPEHRRARLGVHATKINYQETEKGRRGQRIE